ncbi:MAG: gamma carbonic anhydrase family protein [Thaumarchaeota archaeon]|nr:gamma carbonic anhydrase family protein [Nitrososphaerota archaeon]
MPLLAFSGKKPKVHKSAYIAKSATLIGDVTIGAKSSIWPNAVLRGDVCKIVIGDRTSIQDNATVHGDLGDLVRIGDGVTVGHNAILHGCKVSNNVIIGMHSTVLSAEIGEYCIVGAGAVVLDGVKVPEGTLVVGVPAKEAKKLGEKERKRIDGNALAYVKLIEGYKSS